MSARAATMNLPAVPPAAGAPASGADERIDPRRLVAFLAMVFGMFMAILDIQIVSASLTEIQAGLAASSDEINWVQTAYLTAEVVAKRYKVSRQVQDEYARQSQQRTARAQREGFFASEIAPMKVTMALIDKSPRSGTPAERAMAPPLA